MRNRTGFTAIEMAMVATLVGIVTALAIPKFTTMRDTNALNGAKRHVITQLAAARASAIQRGAPVVFTATGSKVWLSTEIGGTETRISPISLLVPTFGVELQATQETIAFDARGYATTLPVNGAVFVLTRGYQTDSLCVSRLGTMLPECGL